MNTLEIIEKTIYKNQDKLIKLIQDVVRIESLSGNSLNVQKYLEEYLNNMGLETQLIKVEPKKLEEYFAFEDDGFPYDKRYSLIGKSKGQGGEGKSLILNGHIDVVPVGNLAEWIDSPFSGNVDNGKIYGRGSLDMKGGLCTGIFALEILKEIGFNHNQDIYINSVCGEETGGCGALTTIDTKIKSDGCIILEPTKLNISHIQAGSLSFKIRIYGKSIHACMANKGINAIDKFIKIYDAIKKLNYEKHLKYNNDYYEDKFNVAPLNVGMLNSGEWPSSVPDFLEAKGRLGVFPGESIEQAKKDFEDIVKKACLEDNWLKENVAEIEWFEGKFESTETDLEEPLVKTLAKSHEIMLDKKVKFEGVTYGSDMRIFNIYGNIPTVLYGPGDVTIAHTTNEYIEINDILDCAKVIALTIINWCGGEIYE